MYGKSSTSLFPTTGHRFPVRLAICATSTALLPYVLDKCIATCRGWKVNNIAQIKIDTEFEDQIQIGFCDISKDGKMFFLQNILSREI